MVCRALRHAGLIVLLYMMHFPIFGSVVISGTRVVFPSNEKEVTIKLSNEGKVPGLVQVWLDDGDLNASPNTIKVPFVLTPPLFRLDPHKGQTVRLLYTKEPLPLDRESVFWLNVLEIPPKSRQQDQEEKNLIQMAFRTRIKIFFRPHVLHTQQKVDQAFADVTWKFVRADQGYVVEAHNPTPYHINVTQVRIPQDKGMQESDVGGMIPPFGKWTFTIKDLRHLPAMPATLTFATLNDYGGEVVRRAAVSM